MWDCSSLSAFCILQAMKVGVDRRRRIMKNWILVRKKLMREMEEVQEGEVTVNKVCVAIEDH